MTNELKKKFIEIIRNQNKEIHTMHKEISDLHKQMNDMQDLIEVISSKVGVI